MLDQTPAYDDIMAELQTIPGADVYRGQYVPDSALPEADTNGLFVPYITVVFGASYAGSSRGIGSVRNNTLRTTVTVYVVSPDDRLTTEYGDRVRNKLLGFVPTDSTYLDAYGGYDFVDADLGVTRYVHSQVYVYSTNMTTPDMV